MSWLHQIQVNVSIIDNIHLRAFFDMPQYDSGDKHVASESHEDATMDPPAITGKIAAIPFSVQGPCPGKEQPDVSVYHLIWTFQI